VHRQLPSNVYRARLYARAILAAPRIARTVQGRLPNFIVCTCHARGLFDRSRGTMWHRNWVLRTTTHLECDTATRSVRAPRLL